jgi:phosphatidate cytidylyltransferase
VSGRRLRVRLSIGAVLIAVVIAITGFDATSSFKIGSIVLAILGTVGLVEFFRMLPAAGASRAGKAALVCGSAALFWRPVADLAGLEPPMGFFCVAFGIACAAPALAMLALRRSSPVAPDDARDLALALLGLLMVAFPVLCLIEIGRFEPRGPYLAPKLPFFSSRPGAGTEEGIGAWLLLVTIFTCKLNDIGGYLVGSMVGRTRLAEGISPKKSVEGAVAGLVLGVLGAIAGFSLLGSFDLVRVVIFGVVVSLASQAGDLCESLIKRSAGVKDSGAVLPAFGGILDLLDSFILAAPAGYTLLWLSVLRGPVN